MYYLFYSIASLTANPAVNNKLPRKTVIKNIGKNQQINKLPIFTV